MSCPKLCAEAATYSEAEKKLIEVIQEAGGARHAVFVFNRPLPKSAIEAKYSVPEIYRIVGDDRFETEVPGSHHFGNEVKDERHLKEIDTYFQAPVCRKCHYASAPRSDKPLTLNYAPSRYDGAFGRVGRWDTNTIQIVSEEFVGLLTPEERQTLELRPVIRKGRGRKFYELLGPAGPPFVAVAGIKLTGWRCSECGHRTWGYWVKDLSISMFIAEADLPTHLKGVFTVGVPPEIHLAVTADRWKELVGQKGTRGFVSFLLGAASEREVVRIPDLPTYEECLAERV